jgi:hypothetical protein
VTLGPGLDLQHLSSEQIKSTLQAVGVSEDRAARFAAVGSDREGGALVGSAAREWALANTDLTITEAEQRALFDEVLIKRYEDRAQAQLGAVLAAPDVDDVDQRLIGATVWPRLTSEQRELLFDYAYNAGLTEFPKFTRAVLSQDWQTAAAEYMRHSGGVPLQRRNTETFLKFIQPHLPEQ